MVTHYPAVASWGDGACACESDALGDGIKGHPESNFQHIKTQSEKQNMGFCHLEFPILVEYLGEIFGHPPNEKSS